MIRRLIGAAALLCAAVTQAHLTPAHGQDAPVVESQQVYVVRHLQKAEGDDPPLSPTGAALAERLADSLSEAGIQAIFATPTRRAMQTAAPLAARLGLEVQPYDPRDPAALVRAAAARGNVLVVGHSNTVHDLVGRFGGVAPAPLGEGDYGTVWHVDGQRKQTRTFILAPGRSDGALTSVPSGR